MNNIKNQLLPELTEYLKKSKDSQDNQIIIQKDPLGLIKERRRPSLQSIMSKYPQADVYYNYFFYLFIYKC